MGTDAGMARYSADMNMMHAQKSQCARKTTIATNNFVLVLCRFHG